MTYTHRCGPQIQRPTDPAWWPPTCGDDGLAGPGLRAVVSYTDGETIEFEKDLIGVFSENSSFDMFKTSGSGAGYGNTVELQDGSLLSASSFYDIPSQKDRLTAVRWRLPPLKHDDLGKARGTNNLRFLSFYGNGNAEEVTAADRAALVDVSANLIATNNLTVCKQAWHAEKLRCMLTVDWVWTHSPAALNASLVTEAAPLISSGGLAVLFLGDEPHVGSEANLARVANAARASLNSIAGGSSVLIYMNHCGSGLKR